MIEQLLVPSLEVVKDMDRPLCPIILGTYLATNSRAWIFMHRHNM